MYEIIAINKLNYRGLSGLLWKRAGARRCAAHQRRRLQIEALVKVARAAAAWSYLLYMLCYNVLYCVGTYCTKGRRTRPAARAAAASTTLRTPVRCHSRASLDAADASDRQIAARTHACFSCSSTTSMILTVGMWCIDAVLPLDLHRSHVLTSRPGSKLNARSSMCMRFLIGTTSTAGLDAKV